MMPLSASATDGIRASAIIETEPLLVKIAKQTEQFDAHVSVLDASLQETPKFSQHWMHCPSTYISEVNYVVEVIGAKPW
jgi:hypothetical protein